TAREPWGLTAAAFPRTAIYLTPQAHHCLEKALRIAGLAEAVVRYVDTDTRYRMRPDRLAAMVAADRADGLEPWLVIGSAGTTDVGAVDPLEAIADVAAAERLWFHVDAAYGGFFALTEPGRAKLAGMERSDSLVMDPHKSLFLPYGLGVVLVKNRPAMMKTHHYFANYMQDAQTAVDETSPA